MLAKVVLLSLIIASVAIPLRLARIPSRKVGYKRLWRWMFAFCILYGLALVYLYPRLENN
jgi:hypothetical protein